LDKVIVAAGNGSPAIDCSVLGCHEWQGNQGASPLQLSLEIVALEIYLIDIAYACGAWRNNERARAAIDKYSDVRSWVLLCESPRRLLPLEF
jgi:hypothetical protein